MKTKVFFAICLLMSAFAFGQNEVYISPVNPEEIKVTPPEYTGVQNPVTQTASSTNSLIGRYLIENVIYPEKARRLGMQGTEVIQFKVTPEGKLEDFKVINDICYDIDNEMIRVLQNTSGMWKPGLNNGEVVDMEKEVSMVFFVPYNNKKAAEVFKEKAIKLFNKGNQSLLVNNNPKKALRSYNKALVYLPYESALLFSRGVAKYSLNDVKGAEQDCERMNDLAQKGEIRNTLELRAENYSDLEGYIESQNIIKK